MEQTRVTEFTSDQYVISVYVPEFNLRFNHFLINDDAPLLFLGGMKQMFPFVQEGVARACSASNRSYLIPSLSECTGVACSS